ncbi:MAG: hypothetical protein HYX78_02970 [Armatimonadetes bacterium]|nr:hypothetical protein [Armatimonadota bacterium]
MKGWILTGLIVMLVSLVALSVASAQQDAKTLQQEIKNQKITLELMDTPIRSALESLFKGTGLNYVLDASVAGMVRSVDLKDVPFDQALKILLKIADPPLVYRKDGDVYLISVKKEQPVDLTPKQPDASAEVEPEAPEDVSIEKIPLNFVDAYDLKALIEGGDSRGYGGAGGFGGGGYGLGGGMGGMMGGMGGGMGMMGGMGGMMGGMGGMMGGMGGGMGGFGGGLGGGGFGGGGFGGGGGYGGGGYGGGGFGGGGGYGGGGFGRYGGVRGGY